MIRGLLTIVLTLSAAACVVAGACAAASWAIHAREMVVAGVITLLAALAGLMPAILNRQSPVETVVQASLAGTMLHMMLSLILAGVVWVLTLVTAAQPFVGWLLLFYFASLGATAALLVGYIRQAARVPSHS